METKKDQCTNQQQTEGKKPFKAPVLTKYGTVKDVVRGPSCKALMSQFEDK